MNSHHIKQEYGEMLDESIECFFWKTGAYDMHCI